MEMPIEMQHQAMGYDRSATMFSPDGHLLQVEYAQKVVNLGSATIGVICKDGVVMIADKRIRDKLISHESATKIFEVDEHIMAAAAGISSDARILIDKAQLLAQQNRVNYGGPIEPVSIIKMIADNKQMFTQYGGARPFGVAIMLAGADRGKSYLYTTDVTGNYYSYRANAIGEDDEQIKERLRKDYKEDMTIEEGIKFILSIFKEVLNKNFELSRFEAGYIKNKDPKLVRIEGEALKKYSK